jgi:hypothetical protein
VPDPAATNLASLLAQARRDRCPACRGPIAAVPRASDRAELTCLEPACTWAARIEGGRVIPLSTEAVDQDDELYPDRPGDGGPACDTRSHRRRPPCRLCRKVSHEGGLCEYHWVNYLHETRHRNPRPHPLDWSLTQMPPAPAPGYPAPAPGNPAPENHAPAPQHQEETDPMKAPLQPCLCGCGKQIKPDRRRAALMCKNSVYRWRRYRKLKGTLDLDSWLKAGQPSPINGKAAVPAKQETPVSAPPRPTAPAPAVEPVFSVIGAETKLAEPIKSLRLQQVGRHVGAYDEAGRLLLQLRVD